jgi:glyoxylase-like metal-dependent hydrolase (beta-lactamase superfamily II)
VIEEAARDIYRIGVPLPENPLKEVNSYFIRGSDGDLLIDTGFRCEECRVALKAGLAELGASLDRLDVLATHLHSDHSGLVSEMAGPRRKIYMSHRDLVLEKKVLNSTYHEAMLRSFISEGFSGEMVRRIMQNNPARAYSMQNVDERFAALGDNDAIAVGNYLLRTVHVPGHTPGNSMFWLEGPKIMFTGDHILFDITPNITAFPDMEDSLGAYLNSLHKVKEFPVQMALPGHQKPGDYHGRIDELLEHHSIRIAETETVVSSTPGLDAYEIAGRMKWNIRAENWDDFPEIQKWYAVGECLSHLNYLRVRGMIERAQQDGVWKYRVH